MNVALFGKPGSGKSTGIQTLPADKTLVINVLNKPLPFKGSKRFKTCSSDNADEIISWMSSAVNKGYKVIVLDDIGYVMVNLFMSAAMEKGYDKFNRIGKKFFDIINYARQLPEDVNVYFVMHSDSDESGQTTIKTLGRMLSDKVSVEGMFTIVLYAKTDGKTHTFITQNDGVVTAKSPMDMFDNEIPNDLGLVDRTIREYYDMPSIEEATTND